MPQPASRTVMPARIRASSATLAFVAAWASVRDGVASSARPKWKLSAAPLQFGK